MHFDPSKQPSAHLCISTSPHGPTQALSHEMHLLSIRTSRPILRLNLSYCRCTDYFRFSATENQPLPSTGPSIPPSISLTISVLQQLYMWQGLSFCHPVTLPFVLSNMSTTQKRAQARLRSEWYRVKCTQFLFILGHSSAINVAQVTMWNLQNRFHILQSKLNGRYKYYLICDYWEWG